jgi:hypothetical protein
MFASHLRAVLHCDRSLSEADEPIKGLENLLQKIRSPELTAGIALEEEMWKVLYTTLFPHVPRDSTPDPCKRNNLSLSHTANFPSRSTQYLHSVD